jgi:NAD(P)-dependent dehydrogenase (short-subunit alcohol dehydrogenase family)
MPDKYHEAQPDGLQKRTVLVTGATGAIGKAIARQIAAIDDHAVVLAARDEAKARQAVGEIRKATGNEDVYYELVDLSRHSSIQALADRWPGRLDVLINNAGTTPRSRQETAEGIEMQFATNVLGYFWMTEAFGEILRQSAPARVVNVASYWAGDLDLDDLEFERRPYRNGRAYRQSKQANRMLTVAFAERFNPAEVTVNVCHPGDVNSKLSNDLGFGGSQSADSGARTPVWLATGAQVAEMTGKYFEHMGETPDRFASDRQAIEALYEACSSY